MSRPFHFSSSLSLLLALFLVAASWTVAVAPAAATFPGAPGAIAFSRSAPGEGSDIWISRDGRQRRLTRTPGVNETAPTYSPNGGAIAYVRRAAGNADIWIMRSDGGGKRPLVAGELDEFEPTFYPSGDSIAFTQYDGERGWMVFSVRTSGERQRRQVGDASSPVLSPNGRWLAYSRSVAGGGIFLRDQRTGEARRLSTGSAQSLDFSPDGKRIAFTGQRPCRRGGELRFALLIVAVGGDRARTVSRSCGTEFISPAWSPSGRAIVYSRKSRNPFRFSLALVAPSGAALGGAPRDLPGSELDPAWQSLP